MLITKEEVEHIENIACNQNNSLWFKFRQGRITAPIFKARVLHFLSNFFSPNDSPSKTEKCFLFHFKSSSFSRYSNFCTFSSSFPHFPDSKEQMEVEKFMMS